MAPKKYRPFFFPNDPMKILSTKTFHKSFDCFSSLVSLDTWQATSQILFGVRVIPFLLSWETYYRTTCIPKIACIVCMRAYIYPSSRNPSPQSIVSFHSRSSKTSSTSTRTAEPKSALVCVYMSYTMHSLDGNVIPFGWTMPPPPPPPPPPSSTYPLCITVCFSCSRFCFISQR